MVCIGRHVRTHPDTVYNGIHEKRKEIKKTCRLTMQMQERAKYVHTKCMLT